MRVERYTASSIDEALSKVQKNLGPDAIVLKTRKIPARGIMGTFGREEIEVTAATPEEETNFRALLTGRQGSETQDPGPTGRQGSEIPDPGANRRSVDRVPAADRTDAGALQGEIRELRAAIEGIQGTVETIGARVRYGHLSELPDAPRELMGCLLENGVHRARAC